MGQEESKTTDDIYDNEDEKVIQNLRQLKKWSELFQFCNKKQSLLCKVYKAESLLKLGLKSEGEEILNTLITKKITETNNSKELFLIAKSFDLLEHPDQIKWYKKSSELGEMVAQHNLAICYENGSHVEQNYELAYKWYEIASAKGHAKSINNLGLFYERGLGTQQNYQKAFACYLRSAQMGNLIAQENVAICYENGDGTTQDLKKAVYWYNEAAKGGSAQGMFFLALAYSTGTGVEQDYEKAFYWYKKSSECGSIGATCDLGNAYEHGIGTEIDLDKAYECFSFVAHNHDEDEGGYTKNAIRQAIERYDYFRVNSVTFTAHMEFRKMYFKLLPSDENSCLSDVLIICCSDK